MAVRIKKNPDLEWFESLSCDNLLLAFSFYRKDELAPGMLRNSSDQKKLWKELDTLSKIPDSTPEYDSSMVRDGVRKGMLSVLGGFHPESLYQMRQELAACGLAPFGVDSREKLLRSAEKIFDALATVPFGSLKDFGDIVNTLSQYNVFCLTLNHSLWNELDAKSMLEKRLFAYSENGIHPGDDVFTVLRGDCEALAIDNGRKVVMSPFVLDRTDGSLVRVDVESKRQDYLDNISESRALAVWRYEEIKTDLPGFAKTPERWSASLDLPVPGISVGLRYLDVGESVNVFSMDPNHCAVPVSSCNVSVLHAISRAVDLYKSYLEKQKQEEVYMDSIIDVFRKAYSIAKPTDEVITGNYAKDFAGTAKWSRALDFDVPEMSDVKGIRYIDFKDCTNIRVLFKNGDSKPIEEMSKQDLKSLKISLGKVQEKGHSLKEVKSFGKQRKHHKKI